MNATTVPPPGWNPIGAPRANTRRFFTRAFAISGAGHLAVLAAVLWIQSRAVETAPRLYEGIIRVVPAPPPILYRPPADPGRRSVVEKPPPDIAIPILKPDRVAIPTAKTPVTYGVNKRTEPGDVQPGPPSTGGTIIDRVPARSPRHRQANAVPNG